MYRDLTKGNITKTIILFDAAYDGRGNLLQQFYNIADTLIVGRFLGSNCPCSGRLRLHINDVPHLHSSGPVHGSGGVVFHLPGTGRFTAFESCCPPCVRTDFCDCCRPECRGISVYRSYHGLSACAKTGISPDEGLFMDIFAGVGAAFLYNFFAGLLRAMGNSSVPLIFLSISTCLNIGLDLLFVLVFGWGVKGAAGATVIAQYAASLGITLYTFIRCKNFLPSRTDMRWNSHILREICSLSILTCVQQSVMNFEFLWYRDW